MSLPNKKTVCVRDFHQVADENKNENQFVFGNYVLNSLQWKKISYNRTARKFPYTVSTNGHDYPYQRAMQAINKYNAITINRTEKKPH